jgi:hypothetical protein
MATFVSQLCILKLSFELKCFAVDAAGIEWLLPENHFLGSTLPHAQPVSGDIVRPEWCLCCQ